MAVFTVVAMKEPPSPQPTAVLHLLLIIIIIIMIMRWPQPRSWCLAPSETGTACSEGRQPRIPTEEGTTALTTTRWGALHILCSESQARGLTQP